MIKVKYHVASTSYTVKKALKALENYEFLSFDTESRSLYTAKDREEAKAFLKEHTESSPGRKSAMVAAHSSGLSHPSITRVTHFIFGLSQSFSVILIAHDAHTEMMVWKWMLRFNGKFLIHRTMHDLKIMLDRVGDLPKNYDDTQLLAKSFINNAEPWKAKVGLKELMADDYSPQWVLMNDYEPENFEDPKFLKYAAIDGAATFKLWCDIMTTMTEGFVAPEQAPFALYQEA